VKLSSVIGKVKQLVDSGAVIDAEKLLDSTKHETEFEESVETLRDYATQCHHWGPEDAEELALRRLIELEPANADRLRGIVALVDILQSKVLGASEPRQILTEAISLASRALDDLNDANSLTRAAIVAQRGRFYLELVRSGETAFGTSAEKDYEDYLRWLSNGKMCQNIGIEIVWQR
jgi:hypothetical protein